jgi:hypothetical protein
VRSRVDRLEAVDRGADRVGARLWVALDLTKALSDCAEAIALGAFPFEFTLSRGIVGYL